VVTHASSPELKTVRALRAVLAAAILVPIALWAVDAWQRRDLLYRDAERRAAHETLVLQEHAEKVLQTHQLVVEQANQRVQGLSWNEVRTSKRLWDDLKQLTSQFPQVDSIFFVDPAGQSAFTTRAFPSPPVDFSDRDYFVAQRDKDAGVYLSGTYIGKISHRRIFNLSMRRDGPAGAFDGVVGVSAVIEQLEQFYRAVVLPKDNPSVALVRDDGQVLASYPTTASPDSSIASALADGRRAGLVYTGSQDGEASQLVAYRRLIGFPAYVAFGIDESTIQSAWRRAIVQSGLLALLAAGALFVTALHALRRARREARAIRKLRSTHDAFLREAKRRQEAEAALLQAQKMEALGQVTGGVAHDFNNLLQVLTISLKPLKAQVSDERMRRLINASELAVQRGKKLVEQLLAFARRQPLKFEVFNPNERLRALGDMLRQLADRVTVELELAEDIWPVEADATQFELAIINLVVNARDAMPEGGIVHIRTENRTVRPGLDEPAGDCVAIIVSDTGPGIPPEVMGRVWEPFFTTKPAGKGTGLGLSLVYGFAKQSRGFATIDSAVGQGTSVAVLLPKGTPTQTYVDLTEAEEGSSAVVAFPKR
jgi:two-component system NtrC family sensor kinase